MGDIATLLTEIFRAEPAYLKAEAYSDGTVSEVWATEKIGNLLSKSAGRYRVNIARRPIDAVLDRLELVEVSVADNEPLTAVLNDQVFTPNKLDLEFPDALDFAETYGDAYLIEWPNVDDDKVIDVFINDPKGMRVIYDPENPRIKLFAGRTWIDSTKHRRVTLWFDGPRVERWVSKVPEDARPKDPADDDYIPFLKDENDPGSWFEDLAMGLDLPVFHMRTKRPYGRPEHFQVYGTQNMLTKDIATMMDATDGYGFPFRYMLTKAGTTGPAATFDDGPWADEDDVDPRAPQRTRSEPGTVAKLTDVDSVGQLQPADVASFLDPIGMTLRLSSVVSNTPLGYFDPSAAAASGISKKEHEKPAVQKANRRQKSYDAELKDALEYALALLGHKDVTVTTTWAPTASVDEGEELDDAGKRKALGVPFLTVMTALGYSKDEVERWTAETAPDDEVLAGRVALLKDLAAAAQSLGTAATLGVIDAASVSTMIQKFLALETPNPTPAP